MRHYFCCALTVALMLGCSYPNETKKSETITKSHMASGAFRILRDGKYFATVFPNDNEVSAFKRVVGLLEAAEIGQKNKSYKFNYNEALALLDTAGGTMRRRQAEELFVNFWGGYSSEDVNVGDYFGEYLGDQKLCFPDAIGQVGRGRTGNKKNIFYVRSVGVVMKHSSENSGCFDFDLDDARHYIQKTWHDAELQ
ncbi:hypothetical protein [Hirschia litorea]|uniref:Lipoprotein n=1 Tax=Hirschia litorea TaxID=1199156 RepID=A0ABW2IPV1_9PROT